ncbi:DUF6970 domain-containing protein [Neolewinella persica]|uniref:DUF6970 domain-containing protein n=1 Tax=Neolewinella persica TaxID=70998 RepID=UPI00035C5A3C|nr:hypothetical protein [Neolewinella persica]
MKNTVIANFYLAVLLVCQLSCVKEEAPLNLLEAVPICIEDKIREFDKSSNGKVFRWTTQDTTLYLFAAEGCCDLGSILYTPNCDYFCTPFGTITGNGLGNCPDFSNDLLDVLVWESEN